MKKISLLLVGALTGCQSIDDSANLLPSYPSVYSDQLPSTNEISTLATRCESDLNALYVKHSAVSVSQKREFALAIGQASRACEKIRFAFKTIETLNKDKQDYDQNLRIAHDIAGSTVALDEFETVYPEADDISSNKIIPTTGIDVEDLTPIPTENAFVDYK